MKSSRLTDVFARWPRASYYTLLVIAVCIAYAGVNAFLIATGREGVWTQDAQPLYANFLIWACEALRQAVDQAASGQGFVLPQYTYSMGYGADVPMTMGSYLQDPINIIVALMPSELIGVSYPLMTLARMIGAAVAFSSYCFAKGHGRRATGIAALAYATCGFIVFLGAFRHPKFIDWAILLPLILQGADRLFEGKSPIMLTIVLFVQFFVSIYYSYMSCVVLLVYCLVKYFAMPRKRSVPDFAKLVGLFVAAGLTAFLLSGLFSYPQIVALLSQGRATSGGTTVPALFTIKYYAKIAAHFIGAAGTTDGMVANIITTLGLLVFFLCGKHFDSSQHRAWLIGFVLCFTGVLIPFLGHVMNGMGYSTDRWMLVLAFVSCYILCMTLPKLGNLGRPEWKRVRIGGGVIAALTIAYALAQIWMEDGFKGAIWPLSMSVLFIATLFAARSIASRTNALRTVIAAAAVIVFATCSATFYLSPFGQNWGATFPKEGTTWQNISENNPAAAVEKLGDDGIYRYTIPRVYNSMKNSALAHNIMGIDYYTSFYNQCVDDFRQELGISDHHMNFSFIGSDSRLAIEDITGAKYYVAKSRDDWRVPYGFVDTGVKVSGFRVYENENPTPLAFISPGVISKDAYESLSMTQKQEALLQGAVVDTMKLSGSSTETPLSFASQEIPFKVSATDGLTIEDGHVRVLKKGATCTLSFQGLPASETYLSLVSLSYKGFSPSELLEAKGQQPTTRSRMNDLFYSESTTYPITVTSGERSKMANPATSRHLRYGGKVDWIFNLCYCEDALNQMALEFDETGDYRFDEMAVVCQPVAPVVEHVRTLSANALDDLELHTNRITATANITGDEPQLAVFMFAYTPGWSVTVDGVPADALCVNTAFLGVEVAGTGTHSIEWRYTSPGVGRGSLMSLAGIAMFVIMIVICRLRAKRRQPQRAR